LHPVFRIDGNNSFAGSAMTDETIFAAALELADPAEQAAYLSKACAADPEQRKRIEGLLAALERASGFLERPAVAPPEPGFTPTGTLRAPGARPDGPTRSANGDEAPPDCDLSFLAPAERPDAIGRIEHYDVLEVLGRGGFGIVFRAFDSVLHRIVAVKVLAPSMAATSPARKRFLREARAAAQIQHENVVCIHYVGEHPLPYLVMEFVAGETLQHRLDRTGPLEVPEVLRLGRQLAEGLAAAHEKGLVHRDIKPTNILIERELRAHVKITDFGLARAADDASLTKSGIVAGTPMYMAPEQAKGEELDHRADLFSLGGVLYAMLTGHPPFRASGTMAVLKRVCDEDPRPICEVIPEVPEWLCRIVAKLHAKNPAERFQSAKEVAEVLADCEKQLQAHKQLTDFTRIPAGKPAPPTRARHKRLVFAACLLTLLGLVGAGLAYRQPIYLYATNRGELILEDSDPEVVVTVLQHGTVIHDRSTQLAFELDADPTTEIRVIAPSGAELFRKDFTIRRGEQTRISIGRELAAAEERARAQVRNSLDQIGKAFKDFQNAPQDGWVQSLGWVQLFNGENLGGWRVVSTRPFQPANWEVEGGQLVGRNRDGSWLFCDSGPYGDFHLRAEVKLTGTGDAGLAFRTEDKSVPSLPPPGYEVSLSARKGTPIGALWKGGKKIRDVVNGPVPHEEWFTLEVIATGPHIRVLVDGKVVVDYSDPVRDRLKGSVALQQAHTALDGDNIVVQFRKIEIKELPPTDPLLEFFPFDEKKFNPPAKEAPNRAVVQQLKDAIAARTRTLNDAQLRLEAGKASKLDVLGAEIDLTEARIKLAEYEAKPTVALLEALVKQRQEERTLIAVRVEAGADPQDALNQADARLADAKARLAKVKPQEVAPEVAPEPRPVPKLLRRFDPAKDQTITRGVQDKTGWVFTSSEARTLRLYEIANPQVDAGGVLVFRAKMGTTDADRAYLEIVCRFPDGTETRSTIPDFLEGSTNLTAYELRCPLKPGAKPNLIRLNLVFRGEKGGFASFKEMGLWQFPTEQLHGRLAAPATLPQKFEPGRDLSVTRDSQDASGWYFGVKPGQEVIRLFELENPATDEAATLVLRGRFGTTAAKGAYLQIVCYFPDGTAIYSDVPEVVAEGDTNPTPYELRHPLKKGQKPYLIRANLALRKSDKDQSVLLKELELSQAPAADPKK
jgi:serine/threonine protein kinase